MDFHSPEYTEGVIKFNVKFKPAAPLPEGEIAELNTWRQMMYTRKLIGQDKRLPGTGGYGNISRRLPPFDAPPQIRFLITGTQTGSIADLTAEHYATILACYPEENRLVVWVVDLANWGANLGRHHQHPEDQHSVRY